MRAANVSPSPRVLGADTLYDQWYAEQEPRITETPWHALVLRTLNIARDITGKTVLEIGCGLGEFACLLALKQPTRLVAADFSAIAVERAQQYALGLSSIQWEVGDIENIRHPDAYFDTVVSCETIEHVPNPLRALSELTRVLKPGGRLYLTAPNYFGSLGLYRIYLRLAGRKFTEEGQPINNCLLLPLTKRWVREAGLSIVHVESAGHYLPFPGRPPIRIAFLDRGGSLTRWAGHHALIVAEKKAHV